MLNEHEDGVHIFNDMCYLTQFIVSCILIDTRSEPLSTFMEQVILTFVMVAVVVVYVDSRFRSTFETIS